jgi:ABC-2 type transport system ATP-binding protein
MVQPFTRICSCCERMIIIHEGKIVAEDRIENLSSLLAGSRRIRLEIEGPSERIAKCLHQIKGITQISYRESYYTVEYPANLDLRGKITEAIAQGGFTLLSLESVTMSLEDIFLKLTTEEETKQ